MANRGVNKVILIGYLGEDPQVRYLPAGGSVTNLRLATNESWRDKQSGELHEHTEWHRIVVYGRTAEVAAEYGHKGSCVYIEGRIRTRKWQDKEGNDRYSTEVIADSIVLLDRRSGSNFAEGGQDSSESNTASSNNNNKNNFDGQSNTSSEEDIPF